MHKAVYSPFHNSQPLTDKRQTTSYKKYPANKYEDPVNIKHQLFNDKNSLNVQHEKDREPVFFNNPKVQDSIYGFQPDHVI